jgi:hypothetical protein
MPVARGPSSQGVLHPHAISCFEFDEVTAFQSLVPLHDVDSSTLTVL